MKKARKRINGENRQKTAFLPWRLVISGAAFALVMAAAKCMIWQHLATWQITLGFKFVKFTIHAAETKIIMVSSFFYNTVF